MVHDTVSEYIAKAARDLGYSEKECDNYTIEHPPEQFGDFATNIALLLAKKRGVAPATIAEPLVERLRLHTEFNSVTFVQPGFINITLTTEYLVQYIQQHAFKADWGNHTKLKGRRMLFEHTDPNPFKEIHIGHLMSNAIGESLSRIAEAMGASVTRICYQGDVGLHVAKALWGLQQAPGSPITKESLGKAYVAGSQAYDSDTVAKKEIEYLNERIYAKDNEAITSLYEEGKQVSLRAFEAVYKRIGVAFDKHIFESEVADSGKDIVQKGVNQQVFDEDNGVTVFRAEKYNDSLHTRVFLNARQLPTYEAKELGLGVLKDTLFHPDASYIITANEVAQYMQVVLRAAKELALPFTKYTTHISHGILKLTSGKMSSRTGDVITAESFLDSIRDRVLEQSANSISDEDADTIAIAAIRYAILRQGNGRDVMFDPKQSISLQGDSGVYLLYSYVRLLSVMQKTKRTGLYSLFRKKKPYLHLPILRLLYQYEEVVERAWDTKESNHIATYLIKLASETNTWYAQERIVGTKEEWEKACLVEAALHTLQQGLYLLGIRTVERM